MLIGKRRPYEGLHQAEIRRSLKHPKQGADNGVYEMDVVSE